MQSERSSFALFSVQNILKQKHFLCVHQMRLQMRGFPIKKRNTSHCLDFSDSVRIYSTVIWYSVAVLCKAVFLGLSPTLV